MTAAWTRKEGKNPAGGLNAKGRASYKAAGRFLKAIEYHIPKLARSEITGKDGGDIMVHINNQDTDLV